MTLSHEATELGGAGSPPARGSSAIDRAIVACAALICLFFAATLRDVAPGWLPPLPIAAPPVPAEVAKDARVSAVVLDERNAPVPNAVVRVFSIREERTWFADEKKTDDGGRAAFEKIPRGETWILAYAEGRARASTRVVLDALDAREVLLVLRPAEALDVVCVDEDEQPIAGAEVRVLSGDPLPHVARTSKTGEVRFDRLGPPTWVVRAWAPGFDEVVRSGVSPGPAPLRMRLERLGALEVTVVDQKGDPVHGATVLAVGTGLWPARTTTTDARGMARVAGLRGGAFDLKAKAGDLVSKTEIGVPLERGEVRPVKLVVEPGRQLRVIVTDGDPSPERPDPPPVEGASVVVAEEGLASFPLLGKTNGKGIVVLGPLAPVSATVSTRARGFVPRNAVAVGESATEVKIGLMRGGALAGDVVDDRGFPVAGATIEVVGTDAEGMPIDETSSLAEFREESFETSIGGYAPLIPMGELGVMPGPVPDLPRGGLVTAPETAPGLGGGEPWVTRADGTFTASPVPPGRVHAIVRHPDYVETTSETVTIKPGQTATVHVVLRQGGTLQGRVVEEDRTPVGGARIELAATHGSLERVTYAADDGTFAFAAVPSEVLLRVARPETPGETAASLVVEVPERDRKEVEIVLPKVRDTVRIRVTDSRGYPVSRVEARAVSLDVDVALRRTFFTDDDGSAELPDAVGLPLRFTLLRPGKAPKIEHIESAPRELSLTMDEAITAKGTVTGRDGRDRIEGAEVVLYTTCGPRRAETDADGEFTIGDLAPGSARIWIQHEGWAPKSATVSIAGDPDRPADLGSFDLSEAGSVEGWVVDQNDEPVAGARVARDAVPTYLPLGPLPPYVVATDRDGRFTLGGLPEGEVVLEAYSADLGRGWIEGVPIRAGRTTSRVKITLPGDEPTPEPRGAGSLAVTLGERSEGGRKAIVIVMVAPGSEAELAGIFPDDVLLSVNGREVRSIEEARKRLTGPLAEDVVLALGRQGLPAPWLTRVRRERVRR